MKLNPSTLGVTPLGGPGTQFWALGILIGGVLEVVVVVVAVVVVDAGFAL